MSASKREFIGNLPHPIQQKVKAARATKAWGLTREEHVRHFMKKAMALDLTNEEREAMEKA